MPRFRSVPLVAAMLCAAALAGCTSTDLGVEPTLSMNAADPALPDSVSVLPSFASVQAGVTDDITPTAYAGPTPGNPISDVLIAKRAVAARSPELDQLIARYAEIHGIPVELLRRVVKRESTFNPAARNGPYWGLMQIRHDTAQTMGYRGPASGLLDAETNLKYAGRYLRGAFITAGGDQDQAVRFYSRGYYYDAKRKGLLEETGLRS